MENKKSNLSENKYTAEDLKIMQSWSLERKIQVTQTRIMEWYIRNNGKVYVSFSGGKDSTVLLDLARRIYPDIQAVYVDTGLEYPEIKQFVRSKENVTILRPEMNFRKVVETYGYPLISKEVSRDIYVARNSPNGKTAQKFKENNPHDVKYGNRFSVTKWNYLKESNIPISHMCCDIMKKKPIKKYERETGNKPILATMACESALRKTAWLKNGCNAFEAKRQSSQPLSFWTEQDILKYLREFNIPYASVYGEIVQDKNGKYATTGCKRTGCVFCGFGAHLEKEPNRFQMLKKTHLKLWDYCMRDWDKGGLGMKDVLEYINVKIE